MKKYKIVLSLIIGLIFLGSCEEYLTQPPRLQQTSDLTLSTYDGLLKAAVATYSPMYRSPWYARDFVVTADLKGGNSKIGPISSGRFITTYLWNNVPGAGNGLWRRGYEVIVQSNNIINALENFEETGITKEQLLQVEGEAKFLRALAYFDMARFYCPSFHEGADNEYGLPVVLVSELGTPERNTVGETYAQIVSDLEFASKNMSEDPLHQSESGDPKGWATRNAAKALLSRVHLYMRNWQPAADLATEIINSGDYRLYTVAEYTTDDNKGIWGTDAAPEIIFEIFGDEGNTAHPNWDQITYIMSPKGYGDVAASKDVIDLYETGDVRANLFTNTAEYPGDFWSLKYPGKGESIRIDNIPVLRLSEMYLIRAEAQLNGASIAGTTAAEDINAIRIKRGASVVSTPTLTDLYNERRRELCYEGHELFDLKRTARGLTRVDFDGAVNQNIPYPDHRWNMPIPQSEIDANKNVKQNPGY